MEEIFSKKAWCNPVAVASSTGLLMKNTISLSDASCSYDDSVDDGENKENKLSDSSMYLLSFYIYD